MWINSLQNIFEMSRENFQEQHILKNQTFSINLVSTDKRQMKVGGG
jgi:hypothetical protein